MKSQKNKAPYWRQMSPDGYLVNLTDGSTEWYHLTSRTECTFEPGRLTYLCADKQYLLGELDSILNDEQRESGRARICKVRVRGLNWSDVFDIADHLEPGGGEDSVVNARGKALEEKYNCDIPTTYHYDSFEAMYICNPLKMGFKAWLEDEGNYWPENPSGYWPETLVVATEDGVEIEVVGEDVLERVEDSWRWRLVGRRNPYPHYIDCDDALQDLKNVIAPDLDVQRAYVLEQIGNLTEFNEAFSDYSDLYDDGDLENLAERVRDIESLTDLTRLVQGNLPPTYTPLYFLIHGAEILQNVEFAHSLPAQRAASVEASGIYGRATPSKLTLTRNVSDFYIAGNGYIFAYEYSDYMDMVNPAVHFSTYLSGTAEFALKFYFIPDQEHQLIIPVKCIQRYQVDEWPDEYAPLGGWPDDVGHAMLPDPKDARR